MDKIIRPSFPVIFGSGSSAHWFTQGKANGIDPTYWADFVRGLYAYKESPLRVATVRNQIYYTRVNFAAMDACLIEFTEIMGHDLSSLLLSFSSKYLLAGTGDQNVGNNWTIQDVAIVNGARTVSVPVNFSGSRTRVMVDGEIDIQSDPIYPSQFGLAKFSKDEKYYIKGRITGALNFYVPAGDNTWANYGNTGDNVVTWWYNTAATTPSNTDLTTRYTATGVGLTWGYNGPKPFVLGNVIGEDTSIVAVGDSISSSVDDGATNQTWGAGLFQRATRSASNNDSIASINLSISSLRTDTFNGSTYAQTFLKYAKDAYVFIGTNDVNAGASLATIQSRMTTLYGILASNNIRNIVQHYLLFNTNTTDGYATEVNQTPRSAAWNTGGVVELLNSWLETKLSDTTIDFLLRGESVRGLTSNYKWLPLTTGAADGLHPNATGHELLAVALRPVLRSFRLSIPMTPSSSADLTSFTRASTATYFDNTGTMQTAAIDARRFNYDPVTLQSLGMLAEDQRTNLVLNSATGTNQSVTVTAVAHTLSFYGTGTVTLSGAFVGSLVGTGAYPVRSTLAFTPSAGSLTLACTGTIQFIQVEAGAQATSYIPTTGATVTRAADMPLSSATTPVPYATWGNDGVGTWIAEFEMLSSPTGSTRVIEQWGSSNESMAIARSSTALLIVRRTGGVSEFTPIYAQSFTSGQIIKSAGVFVNNDYTAVAQGGTPVTDATSPQPTTPIRVHFGYANGPASAINGHLRSVRFYPFRVTNAEIIRLTT